MKGLLHNVINGPISLKWHGSKEEIKQEIIHFLGILPQRKERKTKIVFLTDSYLV